MNTKTLTQQQHAEQFVVRQSIAQHYPVLYHGTSIRSLRSIIRMDGIHPRTLHKTATNWKHSIESNPHTVYLTDAYAHYFAFSASEGQEETCIIEIDTRKLDPYKFVPDEDFLEQATRQGGRVVPGAPEWMRTSKDMKRRTHWFRAHTKDYGNARQSLQHLGTCGYMGIVPWESVSRVAVLSHTLTGELALMFDPTISIQNYSILGDRYRAFTRSIFDSEAAAASPLRDRSGDLVPMPMTINDAEERPRILTRTRCEVYVYATQGTRTGRASAATLNDSNSPKREEV